MIMPSLNFFLNTFGITSFIYVGLALIQYFYSQRTEKPNSKYQTVQNIINFFVDGMFISAIYNFIPFPIKIFSPLDLSFFREHKIIAFSISIFCIDFASYVTHWLMHRSPLLWAFHETHHTSNELNISTWFRSSWFARPFFQLFQWPFFVLFSMLGFPLEFLKFWNLFFRVHQLWVHSGILYKNQWLSYFIITSNDHSIHHEQQPDRQNSNYGSVFTVFDRLFKTYNGKICEKNYGTGEDYTNANFLDFQFRPVRNLIRRVQAHSTLKEKLNYLFLGKSRIFKSESNIEPQKKAV